MTLDVLSASGSCGQGLPSILVRDAALMAATPCRVMRGLPLLEVGPLVCFQDFVAELIAVAGAAPCWAVEADRILTKFELGGICSCSTWFSGSGIGVPLDCLVSLCIPGGFWIETDSHVFFMMFLVDDRSCCFPGERIKIIEALSLLVYGYLFSSQVMYGIQEAAAACLLLAFAWLLVFFVGRQLQPAACTFAGMLVLKVSEIVGSVVEGLFAFGCLDEWEGESLLAGNSPVGTGGTGDRTGGRPRREADGCGSCSSSSSSIWLSTASGSNGV